MPERPRNTARVAVFGASGTIGRAVTAQLAADGTEVVAMVRDADAIAPGPRIFVHRCDIHDPQSVEDALISGKPDTVISCIASRTGGPKDAWAVDYAANTNILKAAQSNEVRQMILLSAICVQKPMLAFQHAKLAFEKELKASGLDWTIVRPTAFFKSLSGQINRVAKGKPFLLFGDGELTRCKPISDRDLARFIVDCIDNGDRRNRILPIGGPGPAITPREQGEMLFALAHREPHFRRVPVALFGTISGLLSPFASLSDWIADKAEYARIARYYATESMLVLDPASSRYDADATPEFGTDTLREHYAKLLQDIEQAEA